MLFFSQFSRQEGSCGWEASSQPITGFPHERRQLGLGVRCLGCFLAFFLVWCWVFCRLGVAKSPRKPTWKRAANQLQKQLSHSKWKVRKRAVIALGKWGKKEQAARQLLVKTMGDRHWLVRSAAMKVLRSLGKRALDALYATQRAGSWKVRMHGVRLVGELLAGPKGVPEGALQLLQKARKDKAIIVQIHATSAWYKLRGPAEKMADKSSRLGAFSQKDLRGRSLNGMLLHAADLTGSTMQGVRLKGAHLQQANLTRARLNKADLRGSHLQKADLQGAILHGAKLQKAVLFQVNAKKADFSGSHLHRADLREAHLVQANFRGAKLTAADLRGAHLRGSQLQGANLQNADLRSADLRKATLSKTKLQGARYDQFTRWPKGFSPPQGTILTRWTPRPFQRGVPAATARLFAIHAYRASLRAPLLCFPLRALSFRKKKYGREWKCDQDQGHMWASKQSWHRGKKHGLWATYENGLLIKRGPYKEGRRHGQWTSWELKQVSVEHKGWGASLRCNEEIRNWARGRLHGKISYKGLHAPAGHDEASCANYMIYKSGQHYFGKPCGTWRCFTTGRANGIDSCVVQGCKSTRTGALCPPCGQSAPPARRKP